MKKKHTLIFPFLAVLALLFVSCSNSSQKNAQEASEDSIAQLKKSMDTVSIKDGGIPIFYNMYLSVEMSSMFQSMGATYNPSLLNPIDRVNQYEASTEKAVNLGVYAVDLTYSKYFDQFEDAGKYLKNMHKLAVELGIPDDKFYVSLKRIENNITNKDSLIRIANELYTTTEDYLKNSDRESAAALIIAGGWIEAMQIATSMVTDNNKDLELVERIADQSVSLNNLIDLLSKFQKEPYTKDLILKLGDLKSSFIGLTVKDQKLDENAIKQLKDLTVKIQSLRKSITA